MRLEITDISFAAYVKMRGFRLVEAKPHRFVFDLGDDVSGDELRLEFVNSECRRHDIELCALRDLQRSAREHS